MKKKKCSYDKETSSQPTMVTMIPAAPREGANKSEKAVFRAFEGILERPDWVVFHSLDLGQNSAGLEGEADFVVLAPGHGIVLVETKSPKSVQYKDGQWYLEKVPQPTKDPLKQLNGSRRSLRGFLKHHQAHGNEPMARLLWFTSLGRHQLDNDSPGDMQFFEWELAWADDVAQPAHTIERVLAEHRSWFGKIDEVGIHPGGLTQERSEEIRRLLLADFSGFDTPDAAKHRRMSEEAVLLDEQVALLDLVKTNQHLYFDGPPGSGKTFLLAQAARNHSGLGHKILVTCFNILMAAELETMVGGRDDVDVVTWNRLLLDIAGLQDNPPGSHTPWFDQELPALALSQLHEHPHRGSFDALFIDEFQDIAANPLHRQLIAALCKDGQPDNAHLVFAGDGRQQIMVPRDARHDPLAAAREIAPHLVHVNLRRNCRMAPRLAKGAAQALRMPDPFSTHRVPPSTDGGVEVVPLSAENSIKILTKTVRKLLETYRPRDITILSPFGLSKSLVSELANSSENATGVFGSGDAKWLRKQLVSEIQPLGIRWHSIFKFKGLESDAVIITDVSLEAIDFAHQRAIDFDDTLYVGMTRAKYHCIVLDSADYLSLKGNTTGK